MKSVVLAEVTRGGHVESVHTGAIVVSDVGGTMSKAVGNPARFTYFRSSAKPFQAIPVIQSGAADAFGFTPAELALCCASHTGEPRHQQQVAAMLAKIGLTPKSLKCGVSLPANPQEAARVLDGSVAPSPLQCDCSGKHTGMLATCQHLGYPIDSYLDDEHPLQQTILSVISTVCQIEKNDIAVARDGCSLPTFGMNLDRFATSYALLAAPESDNSCNGGQWATELNRLRSAMIAHPENVSGENQFVTDLMRIGNGAVVAKSGAEGLICFGLPTQKLGIAVRIDDGSFRSHPAIVIELLERFEALPAEAMQQLRTAYPSQLFTHNGWHVGEIHAAFSPLSLGEQGKDT